jgi:uncharacterized protein (TIGR03437 family)
LTSALVLLVCASKAEAQAPAGSILRFEIENFTMYADDCPNSQLASNPNKLDRHPGPAFEHSEGIGDIVSVNGNPSKGTVYETIVSGLRASPNPMPGGAIADSVRTAVIEWQLDFLNPDGTQIGTIHISGLLGGLTPPGAPKLITQDSSTIIGGSGAFFGVRGYYSAPAAVPVRFTSACEDPGFRRVNAGGLGQRHAILYLVPLSQPQVSAVFHDDFSPVTPAKPAKAGEVLIAKATGLGPTRPGVEPGQPFPTDPLQEINSPLDVTLNGDSAEIINNIGWLGLVDTYRVDFRVPDGTAAGNVALQLRVAWMAGPSLSIPVQ